jgi:hypothetical protein
MGEGAGLVDQIELLVDTFTLDVYEQRQDAHQTAVAVAPLIRVAGKVIQFIISATVKD